MVVGLALVLSLAASQSRSPEAALAQSSAGEVSAADPTFEKLKLQILREEHAKERQLQIDTLREDRPSLLPPLIVLGLGVSCLIIGGILGSKDDLSDGFTGLGLIVAGVPVTLVGLVWLMVDAAIHQNIDKKIEALEAQQRNASTGWHLTPWASEGAVGLALSLPLR